MLQFDIATFFALTIAMGNCDLRLSIVRVARTRYHHPSLISLLHHNTPRVEIILNQLLELYLDQFIWLEINTGYFRYNSKTLIYFDIRCFRHHLRRPANIINSIPVEEFYIRYFRFQNPLIRPWMDKSLGSYQTDFSQIHKTLALQIQLAQITSKRYYTEL